MNEQADRVRNLGELLWKVSTVEWTGPPRLREETIQEIARELTEAGADLQRHLGKLQAFVEKASRPAVSRRN